MQLGTRWAVGADAPASVPHTIHRAIAEVEAAVTAPGAHWTLTWLEGRPIAELDAGWEVFIDAEGTVIAREFQD